MIEIVFATNNPNKLLEVQSQMPDGIKLISLENIGCIEEIPETQKTIRANAIQKADYIKSKYNLDCFADDTGLEVEVLNGAPGVHSARYAGPEKKADDNIRKLIDALKNEENRKAQFRTVVALHFKGELRIFEGVCKGVITKVARGSDGFGYDPIFKPTGYQKTFGELSLEEKNSISHRGLAISKVIAFFKQKNLTK